jgi:hypothetical protein
MSEQMDAKLRETKFFFEKLVNESKKAVTNEPEAFLFYFSAFLEAGYGLRDLLARNGFKPSSRPEDERSLLNFMLEQRRLVVHRGGSADVEITWEFIPHLSDLERDRSHPAYGFHYFATPLPLLAEMPGHAVREGIGRRTYSFKVDGKEESVIEYCRQYLALLEKLVGEFPKRRTELGRPDRSLERL